MAMSNVRAVLKAANRAIYAARLRNMARRGAEISAVGDWLIERLFE